MITWGVGVSKCYRKDIPDLETPSQVEADILSQNVWQFTVTFYGSWVNSLSHDQTGLAGNPVCLLVNISGTRSHCEKQDFLRGLSRYPH